MDAEDVDGFTSTDCIYGGVGFIGVLSTILLDPTVDNLHARIFVFDINMGDPINIIP